MRLFIAINFDNSLTEILSKAQHELRQNKIRGHYTEISNLYQTIVFIGEFGNVNLVLEAEL